MIDRWPNEDQMIAELYGGVWADPDSWARRCRPDGCIVCTSGHPYGIIGELGHTWVTTDREVAVFGYLCVISKTHSVEPFELPEPQRTAFWTESIAVANGLSRLLQPVKVNYEIHGNTLPHLHMHLLPRRADDAFVGRPIDLGEIHHRYSDTDLDRLRAMITSLPSAAPPGDPAASA
jgi:diadenosine tetraphosphate (Ap4A) HIT family hydrolase